MARLNAFVLALLVALPGAAFLAVAPTTDAAASRYYDVTVTSFDGVKIAATVFLPEGASHTSPVPFVMMTHGWAGSRVTTPTGRVADLLDAGYGVLTWDSRGFGKSGGEVMLNSPDYEVKDVQLLLTYIARNIPASLKTGPYDPVVGMSGGSYAGGIQLLAAAHDSRIDVIAPEITWNDLAQSLAPNGVPKLYWTSLLLGAGQATSCSAGAGFTTALNPTTGCQTTDLPVFYAQVHATGGVPDSVRDELIARSPATYMDSISVPTLLVQGFPDTLFDVSQAVANYNGIKANGAPVKLWLYDGGHGQPEAPAKVPNTQGHLISSVVVAWFDCHLKPAGVCATGPEVEYYTAEGWKSASSWPVPQETVTKHVNGIDPIFNTLAPTPRSTYNLVLEQGSPLGNTTVTGGARLTFSAAGLGADSVIFASLGVRSGTTVTRVADQTQPVRFTLDPMGVPVAVEVDLVDVTATYGPGEALVLTLATVDPKFDGGRVPGYVNIGNIDVTWSVVRPVAPVGP